MNQENKSKCCKKCYNPSLSYKVICADCPCHTPQSLEEKGKHQISQERIHEIYKEIKEREEKQNPPTDSNWEDKLALIVAQSAPTTLLSLWKNADFNWLKENVGNLIQSERKEVIGKHNAHILNEWQLKGLGDERVLFPILEKATEISLSSNKPSNE